MLDHIEELSITYDPAAVPSLAVYLQHAEPLVRASAVEGLIQLGERAAIPFLESASLDVPPEEAARLTEAAEFLALPTWTERLAEMKSESPQGGSIER